MSSFGSEFCRWFTRLLHWLSWHGRKERSFTHAIEGERHIATSSRPISRLPAELQRMQSGFEIFSAEVRECFSNGGLNFRQ